MRLHLQTSHPTGFACMECNEAEKGRRDSAAVPTISSLTQNREVVIIVWGPNTTTKTSPHCKKLTDSICYFIAKDMLSLDTVTNPRFQQMLRAFEPRNSSPDRKTISTHYVPELQEKWHSDVVNVKETRSEALVQLEEKSGVCKIIVNIEWNFHMVSNTGNQHHCRVKLY